MGKIEAIDKESLRKLKRQKFQQDDFEEDPNIQKKSW